jgi:uncharacterized protein (TIGR00369 family)
MTKMTAAEVQAFLDQHFPQGYGRIESVGDRCARMRLEVGDEHLRPGGTVSGPTMMGLADTGLYVAILATLGPVAQAVTTNLNSNFLRRPPLRDIIADVQLLKVGRRLVVGEVWLRSDGGDEPVAHVTATYSIPPGAADA